MSDEQTMPDDLVKVNTVGWDADAMQEHVFDCHDAIRTLTAERDALRGDVQAAIDTIKQNQANPTDKYVEQRTMYLLDRLTTTLAQLKEQDDE